MHVKRRVGSLQRVMIMHNAGVSHFTGVELLYLALYDLQVEDDYKAEHAKQERELYKQRPKRGNAARCAKWQYTHPEEYKEYQRRYRQEHRDEINRRQRERRRKARSE